MTFVDWAVIAAGAAAIVAVNWYFVADHERRGD